MENMHLLGYPLIAALVLLAYLSYKYSDKDNDDWDDHWGI